MNYKKLPELCGSIETIEPAKMIAEKLSFGVEPKLFEKLNFGEVVEMG